MNDDLDLGTCCSCSDSQDVRNLMMLNYKTSVPGTGWGCVVCHQPQDGMSAVLCGRCIETKQPIKFVIDGFPRDKKRLPFDRADPKLESFTHVIGFHPEVWTLRDDLAGADIHGSLWFTSSVDEGSDECLCSRCFRKIEEDEFALRMFNEKDNLEARFCPDCQATVFKLYQVAS